MSPASSSPPIHRPAPGPKWSSKPVAARAKPSSPPPTPPRDGAEAPPPGVAGAPSSPQPHTGTRPELLIQPSRGLTHSVASALARPDIHRLKAGSGGFGRMYRGLGFEPSPRVKTDG